MDTHKIVNNRYQLLTVIKRGGFGTIYKGHDTVLGKDIAVKEINHELLKDAWYVDQFQNEARHVAKMNHQNIVHIFDLVEAEDRQFYIIMEFIDGYDLNTLIKESKAASRDFPTHIAVHIVAEICKALDYAHNCRHTENNEPLNLVHQDILRDNIMIAKNGLVKLIDFGIAGAQKKAIAQKDTVVLQGKVQYMSPEHVSVEQNIDRRSDIFSLGLVLYELLEGRRFFLYDDTHKIVDILRNGKLKLKDLSKTPKPLQSVLNKALEKSLDKRYQNANQLYIDLVTYLVLNSDSANIDKELVNFVSGFDMKSQPEPAETNETLFNIAESDLIFDSVLDDIEKNKVTAGQRETLPEVPPEQVVKAEKEKPVLRDEPQTKEDDLNIIKPISSKPAEYFEAGDEIKTVIDVVRLSTRGDKKLFIKSG